MIELYIAGATWGVLTGTWLVYLAGDPEDAGGGALPILLGGGGAVLVFGVDAALDGLPRGVPASISMGTLVGFVDSMIAFVAFEDSFDTPEAALTLLWGGTTLGAVGGTLLGTQLRPTIGDTRLVASLALWGAYFTGLATIVAGSSYDASWRAVLGGMNAGLLLGFLLAPINDLDAGRVMLLDAGVGIGSVAGLLVSSLIAADRDLDPETTALTVGVGGALGLLGSFLLFRPGDPEPDARADAGAFMPFVAPQPGGGMVGVSGAM